MSTIFLERTLCCKVKTNCFILTGVIQFLERTLCCKVKTEVAELPAVGDSWKEHYVVKSKHVRTSGRNATVILGKNIML